jgi:oligoendopeptidase F
MGIAIPQRKQREFIDINQKLDDWADISGFYDTLMAMPIDTHAALMAFLSQRSELEAFVSEDFAWRYIHMTRDTQSETAKEKYQNFVENIQPQIAKGGNALDQKFLNSEALSTLEGPAYAIMVRNLRTAWDIYREENLALETDIRNKAATYQNIIGAMTVTYNGLEQTLQKAADHLQSTDATVRKEVYGLITTRRLDDADKLDLLYTELVALRHQLALNAGFKNYRDYMFVAMNRHDYSPSDCFDFHKAVSKAVVPLLNEFAQKRKNILGHLRPWDDKVDLAGKEPLKPFVNGADLLAKSIACFTDIDPELGNYFKIMQTMGYFDLESRIGKAPGGYNYPLEEIGIPFIFMNATGNLRDLVTMVHEGGHAIHSFRSRELPLLPFKTLSMEVAELASMAMELISMEHWDHFFDNPQDLNRAKLGHLKDLVCVLPWIACIDAFQHWIYENPGHNEKERKTAWLETYDRFSDNIMNWIGLDAQKAYLWQKQLHLYEVPFYYIEYGMAQLGAIGIWRNYKKDPKQTIEQYLHALALGNTLSINDLYAVAGVKFDFSEQYISELLSFVLEEIRMLEK